MAAGELAKAGFIVELETVREGQRPERTPYALTDAGRRELHDWLGELIEEPRHEFPHFVAALSLIAALPPDEVVELLGSRLRRLAEQRAETRELIDGAVANDVHPLFLIEEEYRLALLEAESSFVERFIEQITNSETGWGPQWADVPWRTPNRAKAELMTQRRTALIIGAGIAGPATAMALQKAGIDSVVHEAHPTGADGIGVFLTVGSNGVDALRVLGVDEPVLAAGFPTPGITLRSGNGKRLGESRTGHTLPDGTTSQTIKRADLYRVLHEEALARGIRIEHGKRLVDAQDTGDGVRAVFADGSEAVGDLLIGCDGVHSAVRRIIDPAAPAPTYAGLLTTGGYARGVPVEAEPGGYEMIFGRRAFFGYASAPDGEVWWFANVPRPDEPAAGEVNAAVDGDWRRRAARALPPTMPAPPSR